MHGARGKTIGDINGMKRVEQARTFRITCMPAQARAMLTHTRGNRRARRIRRLTTWGQAARRPTAKRDHRHLVRSFQRADEFERRRRRMPSRVMRFASDKRLRYGDAFTMPPRRRDVKKNPREMNMHKQELVDAIALAVGTTKSAAGESIDAFVAVVTQAVAEGDSVQLVGFGTFSTGHRAARTGRNPRTG